MVESRVATEETLAGLQAEQIIQTCSITQQTSHHKASCLLAWLLYLRTLHCDITVKITPTTLESEEVVKEWEHYLTEYFETDQTHGDVEHKFAELRTFRILGEVYRNFRRKHHLRFKIIAGTINFQHGFYFEVINSYCLDISFAEDLIY